MNENHSFKSDLNSQISIKRRRRTKPHLDIFYFTTFHGLLRSIILVLCIVNFVLVESVTDTFILKYLVQYTGISTVLFLFVYITIYLMSISHSQPNTNWIFQEMTGIGLSCIFYFESTLIMIFCAIHWNHFTWICSTITSFLCTLLLGIDFGVMSKKHYNNPEITITDTRNTEY